MIAIFRARAATAIYRSYTTAMNTTQGESAARAGCPACAARLRRKRRRPSDLAAVLLGSRGCCRNNFFQGDEDGSAYGIRTRVTGVRGRRPGPLDERATVGSRGGGTPARSARSVAQGPKGLNPCAAALGPCQQGGGRGHSRLPGLRPTAALEAFTHRLDREGDLDLPLLRRRHGVDLAPAPRARAGPAGLPGRRPAPSPGRRPC